MGLNEKANVGSECEIYSRAKDAGSATANWFAELLSPTPWFSTVVPNVSVIYIYVKTVN